MKNKYEIFALVIIAIFIIGVFLIGPKYTGFAVYQSGEQSDFDEGTYNNTYYDSSVKLNSFNQSGTYTSKVFDAGNLSSWDNLTWTETIPTEEKIFVVDTNSDFWVSNLSGNWNLIRNDYNNGEGNNPEYMITDSNDNLFIIEEDDDIWKSIDFGYTWTKVNDDYNGEGQHVKAATVDNNNNLYIIEGDEDVWKSIDSGLTWNKTSTNFNGNNDNAKGLVVDTSNNLWVVDGNADVWSSNNGINWTLVKDDFNSDEGNNPDYMLIDNSNTLYIIEGDDDIWRSSDLGILWTKVNDDYNGEGQHVKAATVDSNNNLFIIEGDEDVWKSSNSGLTWIKISTDFNGGNGNIKGISIATITTDLKFQVRSDDDNSSWSDFIGPDGTSNTFYTDSVENLVVSNNQYFQYIAYFTSDDGISSPELSDVNIGYTILDLTPPEPITNLSEDSTGLSWIHWTWTNPTDTDFSHAEIWTDNNFKTNTSDNYYNLTGLNSDSSYEIQIRTADLNININPTWINDSAQTAVGTTTEETSSSSGSSRSETGGKVFTHTREEESSEEETSEEETKQEEIIEETKTEAPEIQAKVIEEQGEFLGESEDSSFITSNSIIGKFITFNLVKFLILMVCISVLFVIYFKYRIKLKNMIKNKKRTKR